jgi:hypothetical protein
MTQIIAISASYRAKSNDTNYTFVYQLRDSSWQSCEKKSTTLGAYSKPKSSNVPDYLNFIFSKVENHHQFLSIETNQNSWPKTHLQTANC